MEVIHVEQHLVDIAPGVMTAKVRDRIAEVIVRGVQGSLHARKGRVTKRQNVGERMEVRHRHMAGTVEIEGEIVAAGKTAPCWTWRRNNRAAWHRRTRIVHEHRIQSNSGTICECG